MIPLNPEIQRSLWLECSLHRLLAAPLVMGALLYLCSYADAPAYTVEKTFYLLYGIVILIWGGHKAAEAVLEEVNNNTWDFQRLSSLSPWQMTWSKVFGSPIYCWYVGLLALLPYGWSQFQLLDAPSALSNILLLLLGGVLCHSAAFLSSIDVLNAHVTKRGKMPVIWHHLFGMVAGYGVISMTSSQDHLRVMEEASSVIPQLHWYGHSYPIMGFFLVLTAVFSAWFFAGAYWQMRRLLRMRAGPVLWLAFSLFMILLFNGFVFNSSHEDLRIILAFVISLVLLYYMAFNEGWNGVDYRRLMNFLHQQNHGMFLLEMPRWLVSYLLVFLTALVSAVSVSEDTMMAISFFAGSFLFITRDLAILHFFKLHPNTRRAAIATIFYLAILYILLPVLLGAITEDKTMVQLFLPLPHNGQGQMLTVFLLSGLIQASIAITLALSRWRRYWQNQTASIA